jgi:hypothetical protein
MIFALICALAGGTAGYVYETSTKRANEKANTEASAVQTVQLDQRREVEEKKEEDITQAALHSLRVRESRQREQLQRAEYARAMEMRGIPFDESEYLTHEWGDHNLHENPDTHPGVNLSHWTPKCARPTTFVVQHESSPQEDFELLPAGRQQNIGDRQTTPRRLVSDGVSRQSSARPLDAPQCQQLSPQSASVSARSPLTGGQSDPASPPLPNPPPRHQQDSLFTAIHTRMPVYPEQEAQKEFVKLLGSRQWALKNSLQEIHKLIPFVPEDVRHHWTHAEKSLKLIFELTTMISSAPDVDVRLLPTVFCAQAAVENQCREFLIKFNDSDGATDERVAAFRRHFDVVSEQVKMMHKYISNQASVKLMKKVTTR